MARNLENGTTVNLAPADATYVTLSTNPTLTNERVLTAGTGVTLTDGGAGSTITASIGQAVATSSSPTFAALTMNGNIGMVALATVDGRDVSVDGAKLDGLPTSAYSTIGANGTSQTQRGRANFISGTGITVSAADNAGTNSTDTTVALSTPVTVANGGTGAGTLTGFLIGNGTSAFTTLTNTAWTTFTPTLTLVGGAGNTVPTFSTTNARYRVIGDVCKIQIFLNNTSGGTAGAGTGALTVALPVAIGASSTGARPIVGTLVNGATINHLNAFLTASATTLTLNGGDSTTAVQGGQLNDANTRQISIVVDYEI